MGKPVTDDAVVALTEAPDGKSVCRGATGCEVCFTICLKKIAKSFSCLIGDRVIAVSDQMTSIGCLQSLPNRGTNASIIIAREMTSMIVVEIEKRAGHKWQ
jgi:hypothetical protein